MRNRLIDMGLSAATVLVMSSQPIWAETATFTVDPEAGNNTFSAIFDASLGERIMAVTSGIGCTVTVDEGNLEGHAKCSVPLKSVRVDNDDTKTDHFQQWATNKKGAPEKCTFELDVPGVKLPSALEEKKPVPFTADGTFTICGRKRDDVGAEHLTGTVIALPASAPGDPRTLRIRARVEHFDRERYGISPKNTAGWLARVQQLANVVATEGTVDVNIFAAADASKVAKKK
jgi:hypothetical protein